MSKKQTKAKRLSPIDLGAVTALIIFAIYTFTTILPLGILPSTWAVLLITGCVIVALLTLIFSLLNYPVMKWVRLGQRILIGVICIIMCVATYMVSKVDKALDEIISTPEYYTEYISIVTLRDADTISLAALEGETIGVQSIVDTNNMASATEYIASANVNVKPKEYSDYTSAVNALYDGKIKAMVLSETYRELIEENMEDFNDKTTIIDAVEIKTPFITAVKKIDVTTNAFTILVSGIDTLGSAAINSNSDANMLFTINPLTKTITMISIPRDSYVPNACLADQYDKLTHTGYKGIDCTIKTIENTFDIEINYYAKISFSSIINLINAIGGVEVDVPMSFCERKANRVDIIYLTKGLQNLNGEQALALARNRHNVSGGDMGRAKNQQLIVNAIIKKCLTPEVLAKMDSIIAEVSETVETSLSKDEIYSLINLAAKDLSTPWTLSNNVITGSNGWGECASIPGMELSIVELSDEELSRVRYIIKQATTDADLSDLTFNINNMLSETEEASEAEGETEGAKGYDFCWITEEAKAAKQRALEEAEAAAASESDVSEGSASSSDTSEITPSTGESSEVTPVDEQTTTEETIIEDSSNVVEETPVSEDVTDPVPVPSIDETEDSEAPPMPNIDTSNE